MIWLYLRENKRRSFEGFTMANKEFCAESLNCFSCSVWRCLAGLDPLENSKKERQCHSRRGHMCWTFERSSFLLILNLSKYFSSCLSPFLVFFFRMNLKFLASAGKETVLSCQLGNKAKNFSATLKNTSTRGSSER